MFAELMIGHHFSISILWKAASPCRVCRSRDAILLRAVEAIE
jgi:hypothetical protein